MPGENLFVFLLSTSRVAHHFKHVLPQKYQTYEEGKEGMYKRHDTPGT